MQEQTRNPIFQEENNTWGHLIKTINPFSCTIEYSSRTGFSSKEEAEESYHNSLMSYKNQLSELKKDRNMPFTFSEYLDYWFQDIYTPSSTSNSTLVKYQWVLYQIILPHLQEDILLGCVNKEFLNKLLDSCQGYCKYGGYYAYKLLNIILMSAYEHNYIQEGELPRLKSFPEPQRKTVFLSRDQIRKLLLGAAKTTSYFEILLALFCGLTKGEILGLKYSDFRRNKHTLTISRSCSENRSNLKEPVFTSLSGTARNRTLKIPDFISHELFKRRKENRLILAANPEFPHYQEYICLGPTARIKSGNTISAALRRVTKNACLPSVSMMDLRRTSALILAEMGLSIEMISHILGHTKLSSTIEFCCDFPDEGPGIEEALNHSLNPVPKRSMSDANRKTD